MEKEIGQEKIGQVKRRCLKGLVLILFCVACTDRVVYKGPEDYAKLVDALKKCQQERLQCEQDLSDCTNYADDLLLNCK